MQKTRLKEQELAKLTKGRPRRYDWPTWLKNKGDQLILKRGEDFECQPRSLVLTAKHYAKTVGISVYCTVRDNVVTITYVGP